MGMVMITVIATGFATGAAVRPSSSSLQTPVDLTPYATQSRMRAEAPPAAAAPEPAGPRLSITRRSLVDLPLAASGGGGAVGGGGAASSDGSSDFDSGSAFDVPAFLRRQES
jgi:hypothetical protein